MRIVGGKNRSREILYPLNEKITRPTKDMVRQGIFNVLAFDIQGTVVLDLFAGSGSMGFESLSRGASKAYFVDSSKDAIEVIRKNMNSLKENENSVIINDDYNNALEHFKNEKTMFDIIFLDPPYKVTTIPNIVSYCLENDLLTKNGIIVVESDRFIDLDEKLFSKMKQYKYGKTLVTVWRK